MTSDLFSSLNGKQITVLSLLTERGSDTPEIKMECVYEDKNTYTVILQNVSKINFSEILYPFQMGELR